MNKLKVPAIFLLCSVFPIWLDFFTKRLAIQRLKDQNAIELIQGIFELRYLENRGAAFGMLQGARMFFLIIAVVVVGAILYSLLRIPVTKRNLPLLGCLLFIFSGAIGNQIDRFMYGYVVDFFYFKLIDFPIFNVADIYVSVSTVVLAFLLFFFYQENELKWT